MLISMTGYGRAAVTDGHRTITVEMKSVNNRYFDVDFSMPKSFNSIEETLKRNIAGIVKRGKVIVNVTIEGEPLTETKLDINWNLFEQIQLHMDKMLEKYHMPNDLRMTDLLRLPGIITQVENNLIGEKFNSLILQAEEEALIQLVKMRKVEGQTLSVDLQRRLKTISMIVEDIRQYVPQVMEQYQARLAKKIKDFLDGRFELDEGRLMNEVAIYADKSDITEELLRLSSHIQQFLDIIDESDPKGRKLDFLVQEMIREINTLGSKSNDATISRHVVNVKSELEKIREQVQNIE